MHRRLSYSVLALASSAALVAGCGSSSSGSGSSGSTGSTGGSGTNNSSQSPQDELTSSFSNLSKASTLTTTLKLDTTADTINQIAGASGSHITADEANAIAGASISVEVQAPSGKTLSELTSGGASGAAVNVTVSDNGTDFITIRSVNKILYIQADVKDLLDAVGQGAAYAQAQQLVSSLPPFVQALFQGKWVSLPESAASSLTGSSSGSSASPQQTQAIIDGLKQILANDVQVTRTSSGSTDQLSLTANSRKVATDFLQTVQTAVPAASLALGSTDPSQIPSKDVTIGAGVTGGALSQLSIDLGQFSPDPSKDHLPLDINFAQSGDSISAPSGAVAVNTQELGQLFGSFASGLGGSSG